VNLTGPYAPPAASSVTYVTERPMIQKTSKGRFFPVLIGEGRVKRFWLPAARKPRDVSRGLSVAR